jgi:hypothetical protein
LAAHCGVQAIPGGGGSGDLGRFFLRFFFFFFFLFLPSVSASPSRPRAPPKKPARVPLRLWRQRPPVESGTVDRFRVALKQRPCADALVEQQ